jgi:hypothetical protein
LECGGLTPLFRLGKTASHSNSYFRTKKIHRLQGLPGEKNCSLKISGTEKEVLEAAVRHAASVHGHENTPELREQIKVDAQERR